MQAPLKDGLDRIFQRNPVEFDLRFLVRTDVALGLGNIPQPARQVDADCLAGGAGRVEEVDQYIPRRRHKVSFLGKFPGSTHHEILALHVQQTGRDLPEVHAHRVTVLLQQEDFPVDVHGKHRYCTWVVDVVADQGVRALTELERVTDHVPDASFVNLAGRQKTARARHVRNLP
ncbi:hypothetical protein PJL18_03384 [Paenarthrobacter nicotinovorans]|nr:hypothetical protein [Paenarthrobacter nicotinovorans]